MSIKRLGDRFNILNERVNAIVWVYMLLIFFRAYTFLLFVHYSWWKTYRTNTTTNLTTIRPTATIAYYTWVATV